jgi:hypothetical protein
MQGQQRLGEPVGLVLRHSIFSRLNNGQSSSSGANQVQITTSKTSTLQRPRKAPMQQVYMPKKVEVLATPPPRARP